MKDQCNRDINYMRISITDRCNLRCRYCMPAEGIEKVSMRQILTYEEILRVCEAAVSLGITRFKVTGGEPLVRKGCPSLIREMKRIPGVEQVTLTTNGQRLAQDAAALREAGLDGVNVSLDSLRGDRYREITGGGDLAKTLAGIDAALACGLKTKVNCLLQKGYNEDELPDFAALAFGRAADPVAAWENLCGRGLDVRFIEIMPVGFGSPETGLSNTEVLRRLQALYPDLTADEREHGNGPAVYYRRSAADGGAIGLISAMHASFCSSCNRIRLTSQGLVKPCLCYEDSFDLRPALRGETIGSEDETPRGEAGVDPEAALRRAADGGENKTLRDKAGAVPDEALRRALEEAIRGKPAGHTFEDRSTVDRRAMVEIGG